MYIAYGVGGYGVAVVIVGMDDEQDNEDGGGSPGMSKICAVIVNFAQQGRLTADQQVPGSNLVVPLFGHVRWHNNKGDPHQIIAWITHRSPDRTCTYCCNVGSFLGIREIRIRCNPKP